jgi:hypothetical protein
MLAELERAYGNEEPIVVTLWHPHWAYGAYDLKDLEDPEGVMGEAEELHAIARAGFSDDCPTVAGWISNFELDGDSLAELTNLVINEYDSEEEGVESGCPTRTTGAGRQLDRADRRVTASLTANVTARGTPLGVPLVASGLRTGGGGATRCPAARRSRPRRSRCLGRRRGCGPGA